MRKRKRVKKKEAEEANKHLIILENIINVSWWLIWGTNVERENQ